MCVLGWAFMWVRVGIHVCVLFYVLNQTFIGHIEIFNFWGLNFL